MKDKPLVDLRVNKETNTVTVRREFSAALDLVWEAWTNPEILDQWWAPKPFRSVTKYMDFQVVGRRFYAMLSPEGQAHWSVQEFVSITPKTNFTFISAFADKHENPQWPGSHWNLHFSEGNGTTTVHISIYNESRERMEKMIEMGFKEGFTMTLKELGSLLSRPIK